MSDTYICGLNSTNSFNNNSTNSSLHKPSASYPDARKLFQQLKQIVINPLTKHIFISVEFRKLSTLTISEIKVCEFFLNSLEYIELILAVENKKNIWSAIGELAVNELESAFISRQFIEKLWIPDSAIIQIDGQQQAMPLNDLDDLFYQLKYLKRLAYLSEEHQISIELHKAFYIVKRWKTELPGFYNEMKRLLIQLLSRNTNSILIETNSNTSNHSQAKHRRMAIQLGQKLQRRYQNLGIDDYTGFLDGFLYNNLAEQKSGIEESTVSLEDDLECYEDICSENIEYNIQISDWHSEGLNKYLPKIEQQLKVKAENNMDVLIKNIYSQDSNIQINNAKEIIEVLENQHKSFQNKQAILEHLNNIQHLNQYYFWIKHLESSIDLLDNMMSPSIANNQITLALNGFSKIRSLITRADDERYLNHWQRIFNKLFEIKSCYSKYHNSSVNDLYSLKRAIFARLSLSDEQQIFDNIDKLDTIVCKCDKMLIELNFHTSRYINSISNHIPVVPSEISVKECIALCERSYSSSNNSISSSNSNSSSNYGTRYSIFDLPYVSLVQSNLDSEHNPSPQQVDLTVEISLNEAKELVLLEIIDIGVYIETYVPKYLLVANERLDYVMAYFVQNDDSFFAIQSIQVKLNIILDLKKMLQQIKEENQSLLNSLNYELYCVKVPSEINKTNLQQVLVNSQLTIIRLEKVMMDFVKIYLNEQINSESPLSVPLIKGIKMLMQASNKKEILDALQLEWICGGLRLLRGNIIKQESHSDNLIPINQQIPQEVELISAENYKATWSELESKLVAELNYNKFLEDEENIMEDTESETDMQDAEQVENHNKKRLKRKKSYKLNLKNMRKLRRVECENTNSLLPYYQKSEPIAEETVIEHCLIPELTSNNIRIE